MFDQWAREITGTATADLSGPAMYNNAVADQYDNGGGQEALGQAKIQQTNDDEQKRYAAAAAAAAREAEATRIKTRMDEVDPKNFKMEPADDGGYNFYDGAGKQIDIGTFARATGARPNELLKDSQNPNDQKFVRDFEIVQTIANAMVNGDKDTIGTMRSQYMYTGEDGKPVDPIGSLLEKYKSKTPSDMMSDFRNHWGAMYGGTNSTDGAGKTNRVIGEPMRQANQLSKEETGAIAGSNWDQITAPLTSGAQALPWYQNASRNVVNALTFGGNAAPDPIVGGGLRDLNARQTAWEEEERRRKTNPWLANIYGAK